MEEIWKEVIGYEGHYEVSNMGNVSSVKYNKRKILNQYNHRQGYKMVRIYLNGKGRTIKVHRLVALAFIDNNLENDYSLVIDHINNDKADNRLENLQLLTTRQNNIKQGRYSKGSSKYVGVYWNKTKMRFLSYLHLEGKKILVGTFKCDKEASEARNKKLYELGIKV
jgi:hypothetical protein